MKHKTTCQFKTYYWSHVDNGFNKDSSLRGFMNVWYSAQQRLFPKDKNKRAYGNQVIILDYQ